jgi:hypothetical protein
MVAEVSMPTTGLVLTSTNSLSSLEQAVAAMPPQLGRPTTVPGPVVKVVTRWGLGVAWTPNQIAAAVGLVRRLGGTLLVRTVHGDPSAGQDFRLPYDNQVEAELPPWLTVDPDAWVEIGNEWLLSPMPEDWAHEYLYHLDRAISAVRSHWPRARIIAPAHTLNERIALGSYADGVARCLELGAAVYRRCDALGLHAYTAAQLARGLHLLRTHIGTQQPIWVTEFALNEPFDAATRAARYRELLGDLPAEVVCLYHWSELGGNDPVHFNPNYRLDLTTLRALAIAPPSTPRLADLAIRDVRGQLPSISARRPQPRGEPVRSLTLHYNGPAVSAFGNPAAELRHIVKVDAPDHQQRLSADSLQYHYCVLSDGAILLTRDPRLPAWHCGVIEGNQSSLAIHLPLGGLQDATDAQWAAATRLFEALIAEHKLAGRHVVRGHREWKSTLCPGPNLTRRLEAWRAARPADGGLYRIRANVAAANVREGPGTGFPVALRGKAVMWPGDVLDADAVTSGEAVGGDPRWLHRRDGLGFVHHSLVEGL